ncbi:globin domain-containing protein [Microscilla marina]|uniref:Neuroglobin n=1 Tax=Microscilla marina ATCC 23134 TaxID=313606 RepID=A1ZN75_MICM2|nr:globin domain-containing protein [Microscilla marina]EAY28256.1 neuroglobin [Microscilla marina ATCC 23134]
MTTQDINLVRNSWVSVLAHRDEAGDIFYNYLFKQNPQVKRLFQSNTHIQNQKLMSSITLIVTKLNKLDNIKEEVKFLAKRHVNYQVKPAYFTAFGNAFLYMLAQVLGNAWTHEMKTAWKKVYQLISQAMIEGLTDKTDH